MNRLHDEINNLNSSCEGKVDKQFVKNLVVGYFSAASDKKHDVARLLARILDFNEQEMRKAGIQLNSSSSNSSSSFDLGHQRTASTSSTASSNYAQELNESIAQQFVHFLEEESKVCKEPVAKKLALDLTKAVSTTPIEQHKTTNLISKPVTTSYLASNSQLNLANTIDTELTTTSTQQDVKPMLIPNSAIINAQLLSKLTFNNGNKQLAIQTTNTLQQTTINTLNQSSNINSNSLVNSSNETIRPIVLNLPNLSNDKD